MGRGKGGEPNYPDLIGGDWYTSDLPLPTWRKKVRVIGCDVAKDFLVLHDGKNFYLYSESKKKTERLKAKLKAKEIKTLSELIESGDTVILEQTGTYGLSYAKRIEQLGAIVLIADGKEFKRFRNGRHRNKNDKVDAMYLRKMYFSDYHRRFIRPLNEQRFKLRALIRAHIRTNKDLTRSVNRLKNFLAYLYPDEDYKDISRYKLLNGLQELKRELATHPDSLGLIAISEIEKIEVCIKTLNRLNEEISSIVINHRDYEILSSFPQFGLMAMAVLIAYYGDIDLFDDKDSFIGYVLMGTRYEQSGSSVNITKTDKTRTEVKGIFYMIYLQASRKNSPYKPLTDFIKTTIYGKHNNKKRFIKFLDKLLEMVYYALKYRLKFNEVLELLIERKEKQVNDLNEKSKKEELTQNELIRLYRTNNLLLVYKDISRRAKVSGECPTYYREAENLRKVNDEDDKKRVNKKPTQGAKAKKCKANPEGAPQGNNGILEPHNPIHERERRSSAEEFWNIQEN